MDELARTESAPIGRSGARTDAELAARWISLHDNGKRAPRLSHTAAAYARDYTIFRDVIGNVALRALTVGELLDFREALRLRGDSIATQARRMSAIKSLLSFAQKTGYTAFNVGTVVESPKRQFSLAERILTEEETFDLIKAAQSERDEALLRFLYVSGVRVEEACALTWDLVHEREHGCCQVTIHGKGDRTRHILITAVTTTAMWKLRQDDNGPVFRSSKDSSKPLPTRTAERIVERCRVRAGIQRKASPHWLRHAHATHALDRGAPIHLVQATLGHATTATTGQYLHVRPGESSGKYLAV